ncbi:hypothetical protein L0128_01455 [candidate division KSB1 bacterium]|nr:hypothetical protein [candidate division KSB1 bacterium]
MKRILKLFGWIGIAGFFMVCTRTKSPAIKWEKLDFKIDATQLGVADVDTSLGFNFYPPHGWAPVSSEMFTQLQQKLTTDVGEIQAYRLVPTRIFFDPQHQCLSSLAAFQPRLADTLKFDNFLTQVHHLLKKTRGYQLQRVGYFQLNQLQIGQFLIMDEKNVNFKLIGITPQAGIFQIDYILPQTYYSKFIKALEASIGSLNSSVSTNLIPN